MKLYLVWNEAKTECVGFNSYEDAHYAAFQDPIMFLDKIEYSPLADRWLDLYGDEECTIQEIEV